MAASTPVHASSASAWGSVVILEGLPKISDRGGDEALEGPGSMEVILLSPLGSGAALSGKGAALALVGWWCWLSWGQQALPPWSLVCPPC
jgi:hypothetical protein